MNKCALCYIMKLRLLRGLHHCFWLYVFWRLVRKTSVCQYIWTMCILHIKFQNWNYCLILIFPAGEIKYAFRRSLWSLAIADPFLTRDAGTDRRGVSFLLSPGMMWCSVSSVSVSAWRMYVSGARATRVISVIATGSRWMVERNTRHCLASIPKAFSIPRLARDNLYL